MPKRLPTYQYQHAGSDQLTEGDKVIVRMLSLLGFPTHRIAALFDVNQGRISETINGQ